MINTNLSKDVNLSTLLLTFIFITLFLDRDISYIAVIILAIISLRNIDIKGEKSLISIVSLTFCSILLVSIIFHSESLSYTDNYSRLLLLLPLVYCFSRLDLSPLVLLYILTITIICSFAFYFIIDTGTRYHGSSNHPITYGNMLMALNSIALSYFLFFKDKKIKTLSIVLIIITSFLWQETETRGSLIGMILVLVFYVIFMKRNYLVVVLSIFIVATLFSSISHRFTSAYEISQDIFINNMSFNDVMKKSYESNSEKNRIFFIYHSLKSISDKPFIGEGGKNTENNMRRVINDMNLNVEAMAHYHNDFLDVFTKYGIIAGSFFTLFIFHFIIFFYRYRSNIYSLIGLNFVIVHLGFMLTQSIFAHMQSTVFFIIVTYLLYSLVKKECSSSSLLKE